MVLHPAEFARKGYELLLKIAADFSRNRKNAASLSSSIKKYDIEVKSLLNQREEWGPKDYVSKSFDTLVRGGIISLILSLTAMIIIENLKPFYFQNLPILQLYILIAVAGGAIFSYYKGPRGLTNSEKKNKHLMELFYTADYLNYRYLALKKRYEIKPPVEAKKTKKDKARKDESKSNSKETAKKNPVVNRKARKIETEKTKAEKSENTLLQLPANSDDSPTEPKKKRFWELSDDEREERKNLFSHRFLLKIAKLKGSSEKDERSKILILDPDEEITNRLSNELSDAFNCLIASEVEVALQYILDEQPKAIITEVEFPNIEKFAVITELRSIPDFDDTPIIVYSRDDALESFQKARDLEVVDYWEKQFDDEQNFVVEKQSLIDKITFVMSHSSGNLRRMFDRNVMQKESDRKKQIQHNLRNVKKILIASKEKEIVSFLLAKIAQNNLVPISATNPQNLFSKIVSEKPKALILDENISEESVFNICKMLNVRFSSLKVLLILNKDVNFEQNPKTRDLDIWKKVVRPLDQNEILRLIVENFSKK